MSGTWQYYFSAETLESHMIPRVMERIEYGESAPGGFSLSVLLTVQKQLEIRGPGPWVLLPPANALRVQVAASLTGLLPEKPVCL